MVPVDTEVLEIVKHLDDVFIARIIWVCGLDAAQQLDLVLGDTRKHLRRFNYFSSDVLALGVSTGMMDERM